MSNLLSNEQLKQLSILADENHDDYVFRLCADAYNGNRIARVKLTNAWNARIAKLRGGE